MKNFLCFTLVMFSFLVFAQEKNLNNNAIHVTDTSESYSYKANFNSNKTTTIRQIISDHFGEPKSNDTDLLWNWNGSYEVSLREGGVAISFGKSKDNNDLYQKLKKLAERITSAIK